MRDRGQATDLSAAAHLNEDVLTLDVEQGDKSAMGSDGRIDLLIQEFLHLLSKDVFCRSVLQGSLRYGRLAGLNVFADSGADQRSRLSPVHRYLTCDGHFRVLNEDADDTFDGKKPLRERRAFRSILIAEARQGIGQERPLDDKATAGFIVLKDFRRNFNLLFHSSYFTNKLLVCVVDEGYIMRDHATFTFHLPFCRLFYEYNTLYTAAVPGACQTSNFRR